MHSYILDKKSLVLYHIGMIKTLFEKVASLFNSSNKNKENQKAAEDSMQSLWTRMELLNQKAGNIKENYPEQRAKIEECYNQLKSIEPSASVRAGKFEHQISVAITNVSTVCDKIFTDKDSKKLNSEINLLSRAIRERQNADTVQEE